MRRATKMDGWILYLFGFVGKAMNEVADEGCSLSVQLKLSSGPQCDLQRAGSRRGGVGYVTETAHKMLESIFSDDGTDARTKHRERKQVVSSGSESLQLKNDDEPTCAAQVNKRLEVGGLPAPILSLPCNGALSRTVAAADEPR